MSYTKIYFVEKLFLINNISISKIFISQIRSTEQVFSHLKNYRTYNFSSDFWIWTSTFLRNQQIS